MLRSKIEKKNIKKDKNIAIERIRTKNELKQMQ